MAEKTSRGMKKALAVNCAVLPKFFSRFGYFV